MEWFRKQTEEGLLGEIDEEKTGGGVIVCRDGFRASTFTASQFRSLASPWPVSIKIVEIDHSSLFCVLKKRRRSRQLLGIKRGSTI